MLVLSMRRFSNRWTLATNHNYSVLETASTVLVHPSSSGKIDTSQISRGIQLLVENFDRKIDGGERDRANVAQF